MKKYLVFLLALTLGFSCTKEDPTQGSTSATIEVTKDITTETIWEDVTEDPNAIDYLIKQPELTVTAGLIIKPGVIVAFESSSKIYVKSGGFLQAIGAVAKPIRFTGVLFSEGSWDGILFNTPDLHNELTH